VTNQENATETEDNPYQPPQEPDEAGSGRSRWLTPRRIALVLFTVPLLLASPIHYWVFQSTSGWFVSLELEPNHRAAFLFIGYLAIMASVAVLVWFIAFILLAVDRWCPWVSVPFMIIFSVLSVPAAWLLGTMVYSYFTYG